MTYDFGQIREGLSADVIVVGGGPAGMCAAIAAAREGVSVLLIERSGACGGMATTGIVLGAIGLGLHGLSFLMSLISL